MSTFHTRHYISLAMWLRHLPTWCPRMALADNLADKLQEDNPGFDRARFLESAAREAGRRALPVEHLRQTPTQAQALTPTE